MSASKQNFLAAHWDWLVALAGVAALVAAGVFLVPSIIASPEELSGEYSRELNGIRPAHPDVQAANLGVFDEAVQTAKKPPALDVVDPKVASFLGSESRVFCQNGDASSTKKGCGRPIPAMSETCPFCRIKQKVEKVEADTDHDGMPNDWEKQYGFNPNDASDAAKDADGDGFTNLEEFTAKTNPKNKLEHPDYLDFLATSGPVQDTKLEFYFKDAQQIRDGFRFTFQRLVMKNKNSKSTFTATMNGEITTGESDAKFRESSGWKVVGFEKKEVDRKIAGSQLTKKVDASEVEIQRLSDGRKVKLVIVPNPKLYRDRMETALESRIDLAWNRGEGKKLTVAEGNEFELNERKYRVLKLKKANGGAELTILDIAAKKEKIIR